GTDFQLGIAEVVGTAEKAAELERVQFTFDRSKLGIEVSAHAGVRLLGEEFLELQGAVHSTGDPVVRLYPALEDLHFLHYRPRLVLVIPEAGSGHPLLQRRQAFPLGLDVKDTSVTRQVVPMPRSASGYDRYQPLSPVSCSCGGFLQCEPLPLPENGSARTGFSCGGHCQTRSLRGGQCHPVRGKASRSGVRAPPRCLRPQSRSQSSP